MAEQCNNYDDKLAEYTCPCCQKRLCIDCWEACPEQIKTCDVCEQRVCPDCILNVSSVTGYSLVCKNCNTEYLPDMETIKEQAIQAAKGEKIMNITKYYCDKCKDETDREKLKALSVCERNYSYSGYFNPLIEFELCPSCREKLGLIQMVIKDDKIVEQPAPNVKDILFDAMSKMIAELGLSKEY